MRYLVRRSPIIPDPPTEQEVIEEIQQPPHPPPLGPGELPAETVIIGPNGISKSKRYLNSYNKPPYYPGPEDWPKVYRYFYRHYNRPPVEIIQKPIEEFLPPGEEPAFVVVKERHAGGYFG
uniref:Uncharacterized protein n=1 Tax=Ditylenchus dipsaci TaxID=166011 RepID=A0A915E0B6_9BILA